VFLAQPRWSKLRTIAVGTVLAGGPRRRSQRAGLSLWAPALGAGVEAYAWEGMLDVGGWQPAGGEAVHPFPGEAGALAAAPKRPEPVSHHVVAEGPDGFAVAGHGVVGEVPSHHACQPTACCGMG
jgi:hypothetical protein